MKKIFAIVLAVASLFALTCCSFLFPKRTFDIHEDAAKFEQAGYVISVMTDKDEIHEYLDEALGGMVQMGDAIDGTDLSFSDCRPLLESLPEVCEKITGKANHVKYNKNAPYEPIMIYYFETPADAERYAELFTPWFKIIQYSRSSAKEYTYGCEGNILYVCTTEAYDLLMQDP